MSVVPVEKAQTIRYPSVALLCVDSADGEQYNGAGYRTDTNQPNRIYINKQRPLAFGYMTRCALTEFNIQWNTPNVNVRNNTLTILVSRVQDPAQLTQTVTITEDFYTPTELCNAIEAALNTAFTTFLNANNAFEVFVDDKLNVTIQRNPNIQGDVDFDFQIIPPAKGQEDLTNMLGLTQQAGTALSNAITGGYASFQYTPYIDIVSNILTKNQNVQDGDTAFNSTGQKLARIYLSNEEIVNRYERLIPTYNSSGTIVGATYDTNILGCRSFVFKREFKNPKLIAWNNTENIDVIDIEVLDYKGQPLYISPQSSDYGYGYSQIGNTADIQFTIQVSEN